MDTIKYLIGSKGPSGYGSASKALEIAKDHVKELDGKVIIVTGCNTGIGKETVGALAAAGHCRAVIMACRNFKKCQQAKEDIIASNPTIKKDVIKTMECDLSSFASIRNFVEDFKRLKLPLNILINNAGIMACPFGKTKDGFELQFGTNHLGHFLLTELLLPFLKQGMPSRIVNVSSTAHAMTYNGGIRFDALDNMMGYSAWASYGQSKLANILHTRELQERFDEEKINIIINTCHPGVIMTELQRHVPFLLQLLFKPALLFMKSIPQGAATSIYLAVAQDVGAGKYFMDCNEAENSASKYSKDAGLWRKLRNVSLDIIKKH